MAKLTEDMKNALKIVGKGGSVVHLTTCSKEGKPNIVAERFVTHYLDQYILIADMFAQKTKVNLNENEVACVSIAHPSSGRKWVFRGPCTVITHGAPSSSKWYDIKVGDVLTEWGNWAEKEPPDEVPPDIAPPKLAQRGVIALKVEEVYSWDPEDAGTVILE